MHARRNRALEALYIATLALLAAHEIDSAYWHEWTLFHLPGGIGLFLVVHVVVLPPFLYGLVRLATDPRRATPYALVLAAAGIAAFGIHSVLLLRGGSEFRTPASMAILVATLLASAGLALATVRATRGAEVRSAAAPPLARQ